ncbi:MAG TPA: FAD-binding protein [Steroidobacteraceae bacterium]|nr:FAD-binding protein [Steroidobacteraceae bacterium]
MRTPLLRRQFLRSAVAVSAALPFGRLLAADPLTAIADIDAVSGDGKPIVLAGTEVADLAANLRGDLLLAGAGGYDDARKIWNAAFDRRPALIARCSGPADVMTAVQFAAAKNLLVAVRGGGHSLSGQSVCDKGLVLDLSAMNGARVDPAQRLAWIEGGALLGALDRESLVHGLATTAGTVSHTGVGGLTTGGGFGRLGRRFALACDNVRSFDVVTADGKLQTASARQNPELYWGLRGGGGNFGVVTSFEFQLHPVDPVMVGGELAYSWQDAPAMLAFLFDFLAQAPDELYVEFALVRLPNDLRFLSLDVCYSGPRAGAAKVLAPLREFRKPIRDSVAETPYVRLQQRQDKSAEHGHRHYIKGGMVHQTSPALIDVLLSTIGQANLPMVQTVQLPHAGGAISRVKPDATAFAQRSVKHLIFIAAHWDDPAQNDAVSAWVRSAWPAIEPHTHGFYVNEYRPDDAARLSTTYGGNFERLVALKTKVDPNNLFRMNANVAPVKKA